MFKRVKKIVAFSVKSVLKKRPSKKTIWKIGLFLVFVGVGMNVSCRLVNNNLTDLSGNQTRISFGLTNVALADWEDAINSFLIDVGKTADWANSKISITDLLRGSTEKAFAMTFQFLLISISAVLKLLVLASAKIFDWVIRQESFDAIIRNNGSVYLAWVMVRDFLNLFFMLALLFSAFSTIFQVEKYHLKKIIILLVVMALLVNFSYPITLFVMDFSNSAMYFFIGLIQQSANASSVASVSALVAKMSEMGMLSKIIEGQADTVALLMTIIFQFILFVTLFAYAINLLIRILAFAILLIFSPAGFTLSFFPSTGNIASSWWDNLIKYAVMGPLMIFFLLIANLIFGSVNASNSNDATITSSVVIFTIPIVFLWVGLIASQKFGGEASASAMGIAKKTGNWVKNNGSRMAYRGVDVVSGHRISGGIGAVKRRWERWDESYKSKSSARASKYAEKLGVTGAEEQNMHNQAAEYKKRGLSNDTLKTMAQRGDAAAAFVLAENKKMDADTFNGFMGRVKNRKLKDAISGKVKQNRADLVALHKVADSAEIAKVRNAHSDWGDDRIRRHILSTEMGGLNAEQYAQQNWDDVHKQIEDLRNSAETTDRRKGAELYGAIRRSFNERTENAKTDIVKRLNKNSTTSLRTKFNLPV